MTAVALSRISTSSDRLQELHQHVISFRTRAQAKRERDKKNLAAVDKRDNSEIQRSNQPKTAKILKKPKDCNESDTDATRKLLN